MTERAKEFRFYLPSWIVDLSLMMADERGVYITICLRILDRNGPVPLDMFDNPPCKWQFGFTRAKLRRVLDHLIKCGRLTLIDGCISSDLCLEMIAREQRRLARKNVPRQEIFERDKYTCTYCGDTDGPFHCDHIVPVSRGGSGEMSNLTTACADCNASKGALTADEWLQRRSEKR